MGRQGRHSPRSTAFDLCWQATRGWSYSLRLQHPKGIYPSFGLEIEGRHANFRQDFDWQDHHLELHTAVTLSLGHHRRYDVLLELRRSGVVGVPRDAPDGNIFLAGGAGAPGAHMV